MSKLQTAIAMRECKTQTCSAIGKGNYAKTETNESTINQSNIRVAKDRPSRFFLKFFREYSEYFGWRKASVHCKLFAP